MGDIADGGKTELEFHALSLVSSAQASHGSLAVRGPTSPYITEARA